MHTQWIDEAAQLDELCRRLDDEPLAVDTESNHFHAYQAQVCLIQVATSDLSALIDPLALDAEDLAPLFDILEDPSVPIVLHAGRNDIIELDRDYGVRITNLFDTQIAARFLDYERNSLNWLLEELVGVETGSQFQRFDWTTRPLPEKALRYAADDVHHLLELRERFQDELEAVGWREPFEQQCAFVETDARYEPKAFDPEGWRDVKGADKLDGRGRAALRALYLWRHELCTRLNKSPVTIFNKSALIRLAKQRPTTTDELGSIRGLTDLLVDEYGDELVETIADSLSADIPKKDLPKPPYEPPPAIEQAIYDALRKWRNNTARDFGIPTPFIATNATFSEIAKDPPQTLEELAAFPAILDWHIDMLGEEMLAIIETASR